MHSELAGTLSTCPASGAHSTAMSPQCPDFPRSGNVVAVTPFAERDLWKICRDCRINPL